MTAAQLAVALARQHQRVIAVDGNLQQPRLHELLGVSNHVGLAELLVSVDGHPKPPLDGYLQLGPLPMLRVLAAGGEGMPQLDLMRSSRLLRVVDALRECADIVILDVPPIFDSTDSLWLAAAGDAVLFVVAARRTSTDDLSLAVDLLHQCVQLPVGAVLVQHSRRSPRRLAARPAFETYPRTYPLGETHSGLAGR
jgi:Mrp family chromosome partitioning ATPase